MEHALNPSRLRFTLLQARNPADDARLDEQRAFAARLGLAPEELRSIDVLSAKLDDSVLEGCDVLLVGGSGEYSVLDAHPPIVAFIDFLARAADSGRPIFASCFGFQALVQGLGGSVVADEDHAEVGTYWLERLPAAANDALFHDLPDGFWAQLGHKDRAETMPACLVPLARSAVTPYQAFRMRDRPVYGTQFHPELTWRDNRGRFERYMVQYGRLFGEDEAVRRLESHRPSPEANTLLGRFVERIVRAGEGSS